jgi:hypothetical protein
MMMIIIIMITHGRLQGMRKKYTTVYPKVSDWPLGARTANGTALCH